MKTHDASQNFLVLLGRSWFLRCLNQVWIFLWESPHCFDKLTTSLWIHKHRQMITYTVWVHTYRVGLHLRPWTCFIPWHVKEPELLADLPNSCVTISLQENPWIICSFLKRIKWDSAPTYDAFIVEATVRILPLEVYMCVTSLHIHLGHQVFRRLGSRLTSYIEPFRLVLCNFPHFSTCSLSSSFFTSHRLVELLCEEKF